MIWYESGTALYESGTELVEEWRVARWCGGESRNGTQV